MMHFADVADIVEGTLSRSLAEFEPIPDALDTDFSEVAGSADAEPQWVGWETAKVQFEWAATELMSLTPKS